MCNLYGLQYNPYRNEINNLIYNSIKQIEIQKNENFEKVVKVEKVANFEKLKR